MICFCQGTQGLQLIGACNSNTFGFSTYSWRGSVGSHTVTVSVQAVRHARVWGLGSSLLVLKVRGQSIACRHPPKVSCPAKKASASVDAKPRLWLLWDHQSSGHRGLGGRSNRKSFCVVRVRNAYARGQHIIGMSILIGKHGN